jgi:hypothetical protein
MNDIENITGMTDEEADSWDEFFTKNPPNVDPGKNRLARKATQTMVVDDFSADYIVTKAKAVHKTPTEVISEMVRRDLASGL